MPTLADVVIGEVHAARGWVSLEEAVGGLAADAGDEVAFDGQVAEARGTHRVQPGEVELPTVFKHNRAQVELVRARRWAVGDPGTQLRAGEPGRLVEILDVDVGRARHVVGIGLKVELTGAASSTRRSTPASITCMTTGPNPP